MPLSVTIILGCPAQLIRQQCTDCLGNPSVLACPYRMVEFLRIDALSCNRMMPRDWSSVQANLTLVQTSCSYEVFVGSGLLQDLAKRPVKTPNCNPHPLREHAPGCSPLGFRGRCAWERILFQDEPFTLSWRKCTACVILMKWHFHVGHQLFITVLRISLLVITNKACPTESIDVKFLRYVIAHLPEIISFSVFILLGIYP